MPKKLLIVLAVFLVACACVFGVGSAADSQVGLPQAIVQESACPVVGCVSGSCHGLDDVPAPDGVHELTCPEASCSSVECHAWDSLLGRYCQASDASLNLWIMLPVLLVVVSVLLIKKTR